MNRYLLFAGSNGGEERGFQNYVSSFKSGEKALEIAHQTCHDFDWVQIVDMFERTFQTYIWSDGRLVVNQGGEF